MGSVCPLHMLVSADITEMDSSTQTQRHFLPRNTKLMQFDAFAARGSSVSVLNSC